MSSNLAFVLGGGGARGAMQVGALRALIEAGLKPDLLVGTSIGAVNASALALFGPDLAGVDALERAWHDVADSYLLDPRLAQLALRMLLGLPSKRASERISQVFISAGITPDLTFGQITGARLALIGADLTTGQPVIYGQNPRQSVLDGLLASVAIPPWFPPVERDGSYIVDGGALSNVPVEPALTMGAGEIVVLDLDDPDTALGSENRLGQRAGQFMYALSRRHVHLETALAEARGVPVHTIELRSHPAIPIWDFRSYRPLITAGYEIALTSIANWRKTGELGLMGLTPIPVTQRPVFAGRALLKSIQRGTKRAIVALCQQGLRYARRK